MRDEDLADEVYKTFDYAWRANPDSARSIVENPRFGKVERFIHSDSESNPTFDQYCLSDNPGAIIVPWRRNESSRFGVDLGLMTEYRPVPNQDFLAFPRGYAESCDEGSYIATAKRELREEVGERHLNSKFLGMINPNTAFYKTPVGVVSGQVVRSSTIALEEEEHIKRFDYVALEDMPVLECGLSAAALGLFLQHHYLQKNSWSGYILPGQY